MTIFKELLEQVTFDEVWAALNPDNKVSLYANVGGDVKLYNKHLGQ